MTAPTTPATSPPVTVNLVLRQLLDDLAEAAPAAEQSVDYRRGFTAGIRFARICVLDEIVAVSGSLDRIAATNGRRRDREQVRIEAALRTIEQRVRDEPSPSDDEAATGYREAIGVVLELISRLQKQALRE